MDQGDAAQVPIPAATVVIMRESAAGAPQLLMLERAMTMRFAGGALVFPGGRVDPADYVLAERMGGGEDVAGRIAAVRESIEEAGVALGFRDAPDAVALRAMRAALHAGEPLAALVSPDALDLDALVPFARWLPRGVTHRVFDTHFYLARWPADAPPPVVDATENSRLAWMTAAEVLAADAAGDAAVIFPTRRNLERLAQYASFEQAAADAAAHPIRTITPWIETREGTEYLCIPDDLGYPVAVSPMQSLRRA